MNKEEFLELNNEINKYLKKIMFLAIITSIFALIGVQVIKYIQSSSDMSLVVLIIIVTLIIAFMMTPFAFIYISKYENLSDKKRNWIDNNEELLLEEAINHEYKIINFHYVRSNFNIQKQVLNRTNSFTQKADLIEVIYLKDGKEHKLITEAFISNQNPTYICYIEFDENGTFYKNGIFNIIFK